MFSRIRSDIQCILDRDPAARSSRGFFERHGFEPAGEPHASEGVLNTWLSHVL